MALDNGGGIIAPREELQQLGALNERFGPLIRQMQASGKWAYQEGIVSLLISDVQAM